MRRLFVVSVLLLAACESAADKHAREEKAAQHAIADEANAAHQAAALPITGKWDEAHLVERMVRAGLAPQALPGEKGERYFNVPVLAYRLGPNTLYVYIYPDSSARRSVTSALDSLTAAPRGQSSPYDQRHILIKQNNLAAVMVGGTDTQQERVALALEAGLPVPKKP